jgi:hypothetical protein
MKVICVDNKFRKDYRDFDFTVGKAYTLIHGRIEDNVGEQILN